MLSGPQNHPGSQKTLSRPPLATTSVKRIRDGSALNSLGNLRWILTSRDNLSSTTRKRIISPPQKYLYEPDLVRIGTFRWCIRWCYHLVLKGLPQVTLKEKEKEKYLSSNHNCCVGKIVREVHARGPEFESRLLHARVFRVKKSRDLWYQKYFGTGWNLYRVPGVLPIDEDRDLLSRLRSPGWRTGTKTCFQPVLINVFLWLCSYNRPKFRKPQFFWDNGLRAISNVSCSVVVLRTSCTEESIAFTWIQCTQMIF